MLFSLFYFVPPPAARNPQLGRNCFAWPSSSGCRAYPFHWSKGRKPFRTTIGTTLLHAGSEVASFKQEAQALRTYRAERDRLLAEARVPEREPPEQAEIRRRLIGDAEYQAFRRGAAARK